MGKKKSFLDFDERNKKIRTQPERLFVRIHFFNIPYLGLFSSNNRCFGSKLFPKKHIKRGARL